jgi:hypothetical protein
MSAASTSRERTPFKGCVPIPYHAAFDAEQFVRLKAGLIPQAMEDKWCIYYEEPELFFHRSWTGQPVYRLTLATLADGGATVSEALWSKEFAVVSKHGPGYQAQLLDFLVANLLLRQSKSFPLPSGLREPMPGVFQHHVSGTGFPESRAKSIKPWWRFW